MAPTKLKFKGNKAFSMLSTIENETDLSKTWRLMTKVKDALEYGKRLENLSWRLWFMHHAMVHDKKTENKFKKLSTWTTRKLEFEKSTELKKLAPVTAYRTRLPDGDKKGKKKSPTKKQTKSSTTQKTPPKNDLSSASSIATAPAPAPAQEPSSSQTEPEVTVKLKREDPAPTNDDQTTVDASDVTANNLTTSGVDNDVTKDYVKVDESIPIVEGNNLADGNMSPLSNETISQDGENFELTELVVNNVSVNDESDLNPSNMEEIFSMNGTDFVLHQFTTDQDPYQVVTLPGPFVGYDARAYIHPDRLPVMELDLEQWRLFYPHTPESSEPPSPTDIDWPHGTSTMLPVDAVTQSSSGIQSNLQYQIASSSNHQLVSNHSAVYVPRNGSTHTSNLMSALNQNLDAGNVTDLSGNNIMSNVSGSSIVYVNSQYTTDPSSNLAVTQSGNSAAAGSGSQPTNQRQAPSTSEGRPKKAHSSGEQQCFNCGVTSTPLWRRSANDELLCNACGLYLKLHKMARPKTMKPHIVRKDARDDETAQPVCSNCGTMTTPLWRRDEEGQTLCNACGLYFKLHHEKRPLSMKTDVIKKRQRYENGQNPNRRTSKKQRSTDGTSVEVQQQQHQHQQSLYAPISVSPTSASMPIPSSNVASMSTLTPSSTPAMNVPTTLGLISTVDQENSSQPISITSPTSSMTQPAPNRSMHGSFSRE